MSVRLRVPLVFTAVMAVVLLGPGLFLYLRLGHELDAGIERNLKARAGVYAAGQTAANPQGPPPPGPRGARPLGGVLARHRGGGAQAAALHAGAAPCRARRPHRRPPERRRSRPPA